MFKVLVKSVKEDGVAKGAYAGLSASLLRQMTYSMTRFAVYDTVKEGLSVDGEPLPLWKLAIAGSIGGGAGGLAGNPADVVLVRMISDVVRPPAEQFHYRHAGDGVVQIIRQEGTPALFRGLAPNVARAILMNASQLATYDFFKGALMKTSYFVDGLATHFTAGLMAGTIATTVQVRSF
ncbi:MAG: Mitochondrial dicarboxylate transporter [Cyphobasidiales sp. Tagirdzhanova-0007]|nr:MAG: Mitochondrial dicarboxylate transporter [Cyphobasidiales sp. Tagirdzhanova-0007]